MKFLIYYLAAAAILQAGSISDKDCREATPEDSRRLASYLTNKYHIPLSSGLHLDKDDRITGCYHKLLFRGKGPLGEFQYSIYGTPDLRFLTTDLFDSYSDPVREQQEKARTVMDELVVGEHASRGPKTALVTAVLFSDFQCPYCKKLESLISAEPLLQSDKIRLIFRHMPLAGHGWAQQAAESATCAAYQNQTAFWKLHDELFAYQQSIKKETAGATIRQLAAGIPGLDIKQFDVCIERQMSLGAVLRDRELATRLGVHGTPTLFLNGEETHDISSGPALHRVLEEALARAETNRETRISSPQR